MLNDPHSQLVKSLPSSTTAAQLQVLQELRDQHSLSAVLRISTSRLQSYRGDITSDMDNITQSVAQNSLFPRCSMKRHSAQFSDYELGNNGHIFKSGRAYN